MTEKEKWKKPKKPSPTSLYRTGIRLMESAFPCAMVHIDKVKLTTSSQFSTVRIDAPNLTKVQIFD